MMNFLWLPGLCCYFAWLLVACSGSSRATLSPDGLALLELKSHITPDLRARVLEAWKDSDDTPCGWYGVSCVPSGTGAANASDVSRLDLSIQSLQGSLSASLGSLAYLTHLDLRGNMLSGAIPDEIVNCKLVNRLDLSNNLLNGSIPSNLSQLRGLEYLDLSGNSLSGPIPALGALTNLTWLDLSGNDLGPGDVGALGLARLAKLQHLRLDGNRFTGSLPRNLIVANKALRALCFSGYLTAGKFPDLSASQNLRELRMVGAQLEGPVPDWIGNLTSLTILNLSSNNLSGKIPPGMWSTSLLYVDLSGNQISGAIPAGDLPQFYERAITLNLSSNRLTGNIPAWANGDSSLVILDLSNNELAGPIPTRMISSSSLRFLYLQKNRLSGDIPSLWSNVTPFQAAREPALEHLELQGNQLSGNIGAATCASWGNPTFLDLSHNSGVTLVNSSLDLLLTNSSRLEELYLSNIGSSGRLRPSAGVPIARTFDSQLTALDLSHSNLEGDLSQSIFADAHLLFTQLESLNLSGNRLTGQIPLGLTVTRKLRVLDLSSNLLSGPLPAFPPHLLNASFFAGNPGLCGFPLDPCKDPSRKSLVLPLALALVGCLLLLAASCVLFARRLRKSNLRHQQDAELIAAMRGKKSANLMPLAELRKATSNFSQESQIGVGGFGTVYKGTLKDGTRVAIKRSKRGGSQQDKEQFLNEVNILSHLNHRNLVRLLGCCLENKVALLVFEYVPSGTLRGHLRKSSIPSRALTWEERVRIALQTADALDYLHSAANPPIFHRDVKSANILLDEDMNAKVADFGISKLAPLDATHVSTKAVQGTMGYIDPEYYTTFQLTAMSDVYSFGVVLLELISAQAAMDLGRDPEEAALSTFATSLIGSGNLEDLCDPAIAHIFTDSDAGKESIAEVAALAVKCLQPRSRDRPSMLELSQDLRALWLQLLDPTVFTDDHGQQGSGPDHSEHTFSVDGGFLSEASLLVSYCSGR